ncbi:DUF7007 domain-containing protein (plasmid) [Pseudarthrobacter sp. P1]|uniref:DUF7007 domain-containing protein n=1 Tax=Pseudarthrobacter sp. P1 TaxID=3418418 RepID=UPI003CE8E90C
MATNPAHARQPQGIPTGGQFAPTVRAEPCIGLDTPASPFRDADGTGWTLGGDEYTDTYTSTTDDLEIRVSTDIRAEGATVRVTDRRGVQPAVLLERPAEDIDGAKEAGKAERQQAIRYGYNTLRVGSKALRGTIETVTNHGAGIDSVRTTGHGYLVLSGPRNRDVDPAWCSASGWYERDCAWVIPVLTHHQSLPPAMVATAHTEARRWFPDKYAAVVGADPARYGVERVFAGRNPRP